MANHNNQFKQTVQENMKSIFDSSAYALSSSHNSNPFKAFASQVNLQKQKKLKETINVMQKFDEIPENKNFLSKLYKKQRKNVRDPIIRKTDLGSTQQTFNEKELDVLQLIEKGFIIHYDEKKTTSFCDSTKAIDLHNLHKMLSSQPQCLEKSGFTLKNFMSQNKINYKKSNKKESKALIFEQHRKTSKKYSKMTQMLKYKISDFFLDSVNMTKDDKENRYIKENKQFENSIFGKSKYSKQQEHQSNIYNKKVRGGYTVASCIQNAQKKIARMPSSVFLTKQRKQALYQCQVLRSLEKLKRERNCQFQMIDQHLNTSQNKSYEQQQQMNYSSLKDHVFEMAEASEILKKNYNRIKKQRKRVIEKLKL